MTSPYPIDLSVTDNASALLRHFADLRDGTHGQAHSRADKEALFATTATLMDSPCRSALTELNAALLLNTGTIHSTGVARTQDGGLGCSWTLSWPRQVAAEIPPITLTAYFGRNFHHPHLRGGTVRDWPLNVFTPLQAAGELPTLRAIAAAELHNLVFLADFRIVPATGPAEAVSPW
ncbi:hypothetical protein SAMN05216368_107258 [Cryobacterium flavum]|uniref:Uncharacterized protein n=1 Tax=Cryobacterium flavum TaxID=1424659 RepID=A0A4R8V2U9_9MICO|nr:MULTISPECIES: hypothetical protein [Cryobacterium]TFB75728.1 hypothetical protein E3O21_13030 [Cryobacterium flavum]SDN82944.1 hypothetical protein SAMN05216368_107258 [Cryobacterium flavum]